MCIELLPHAQEFGKTKIYIILQDDKDDLSKEVRYQLSNALVRGV